MKDRLSAFTLIELLVVSAIIVVISAVVVTAFNNFSRSQQLDQAAKELTTILKEAQNRALTSVEGRNWGVRIVNNQTAVTLFSSNTNSYNARATSLVRDISANVEVSAMRLGNPNSYLSPTTINIIFSVSNGSVVFIDDTGACSAGDGGSGDSACASQNRRCLSLRLNLQGGTNYRYIKTYERNIFEDPDGPLTPCP